MKTIPSLALILAAFAAFAFSPLTFEASVSLLFGAGLVALMFADYTRRHRPLVWRTAPAVVASQRTERLGLAA